MYIPMFFSHLSLAPKSKEGVVDSKDDPQKAHPPTPVASGKAVAMYEFEGNAEGDLALKVRSLAQVVHTLSKSSLSSE